MFPVRLSESLNHRISSNHKYSVVKAIENPKKYSTSQTTCFKLVGFIHIETKNFLKVFFGIKKDSDLRLAVSLLCSCTRIA